MSRWPNAIAAATLLGAATMWALPAQAQPAWSDIGRAATPAEVAAWDIDVRPDFKGLPEGSGSVDDGMDLWEDKCAVCHGIFGESNSVFNPIVGGTTAEDVQTGRVASLARGDYPGVTTFMKVPTISTIWDYINRAMPWDNPKSLSADEVYAATAYLLNLADVIPDDFVLSNENIAQVQEMMPNRNGMTLEHTMWPGDEFGTAKIKDDVQAQACMSDCGGEPEITSDLPDHARNVWGNLREQNRTVGPQRGADTSQPEGELGDAAGPVNIVGPVGAGAEPEAVALVNEHGCMACHGMDKKLVGPALRDVAAKYQGDPDTVADSIRNGSPGGTWGDAPMPPQDLSDEVVQTIAQWLADGASN